MRVGTDGAAGDGLSKLLKLKGWRHVGSKLKLLKTKYMRNLIFERKTLYLYFSKLLEKHSPCTFMNSFLQYK